MISFEEGNHIHVSTDDNSHKCTETRIINCHTSFRLYYSPPIPTRTQKYTNLLLSIPLRPTSYITQNLSILRLDEIRKRLWLLVAVVVMSVVAVSVWVFLWPDVVHLVDGATFWAALYWAVFGHLDSKR